MTPQSASKQPASRIVKAVETNLGRFGNRIDVMVVDDGSVRGMSLLEPLEGVLLISNSGHVALGQLDLFNLDT